jgi:hypothetical protein
VDDIIYFSTSDTVEKAFEKQVSAIGTVDFMGQVSHFLGIEFSWNHHEDGNLSVSLTQQSFMASVSSFVTPYHSGVSMDSFPSSNLSSDDQDKLCLQYQSLVGSLNWLAHTAHPDLSTVLSLLAQHQSNPSPGHMTAALHAVKYLAQTKSMGIYFSSC